MSHVLQALGHAGDVGSFRASLALDSPADALDRLMEALAKVVGPVRAVSGSR